MAIGGRGEGKRREGGRGEEERKGGGRKEGREGGGRKGKEEEIKEEVFSTMYIWAKSLVHSSSTISNRLNVPSEKVVDLLHPALFLCFQLGHDIIVHRQDKGLVCHQ